ncbi:hypothetical protein GJ496_008115 [Pomphorhynchus laevis]|nr:hypothetical protein GJ496_008115 [Pomphorhynchus laevis]
MGDIFSSKSSITFTVKLDKDIFYCGDKLSGEICFGRKSPRLIKKVDINLWGEAVYTVEQSSIRDCDGIIYHTVRFLNCTDSKVKSTESDQCSSDLTRFSLDIPSEYLPPSFKGQSDYPAVRYWLKCTVTWLNNDNGTGGNSQSSDAILPVHINGSLVCCRNYKIETYLHTVQNIIKIESRLDKAIFSPDEDISVKYQILGQVSVRVLDVYVILNRLVSIAGQESVTRITFSSTDEFNDEEPQINDDGEYCNVLNGNITIQIANKELPISFNANVGIDEIVYVQVSYEILLFVDIQRDNNTDRESHRMCIPVEIGF